MCVLGASRRHAEPRPAPFLPAQSLLSVVIPAFNEEARLPTTLARAHAHLLSTFAGRFEIIVVDDGSTDGTVASVVRRGLGPSLRVLSSPRGNLGKGAAVAAGASAARGDLILLMDADGAADLQQLDHLEAELRSSRAHLAIGSRAALTGARPWPRWLMGRAFSLLASSVVEGVEDTQCGFKLFTREAAALLPQLRVRGWAFDVELLGVAQAAELTIAVAPISWRDVGGSKVGLAAPVKMAVDVVRVLVMYRMRVWELPRPGEWPATPRHGHFRELGAEDAQACERAVVAN